MKRVVTSSKAAILKVYEILKRKQVYVLTRYVRKIPVIVRANFGLVVEEDTYGIKF